MAFGFCPNFSLLLVFYIWPNFYRLFFFVFFLRGGGRGRYCPIFNLLCFFGFWPNFNLLLVFFFFWGGGGAGRFWPIFNQCFLGPGRSSISFYILGSRRSSICCGFGILADLPSPVVFGFWPIFNLLWF